MAFTLEETKIDTEKLQAVMGKIVTDFGSTISAGLMVLGDKLGLYKAMAGTDPLNADELAERTGTNQRSVREWLVNQAAGGYVEYDPETGRHSLPPEHALALANEDNPFFVAGGFELFVSALRAEPRIEQAFRTGEGMGWASTTVASLPSPSASSSPATWATW